MSDFQVIDIDLKVSQLQFEEEMHNAINNYPETMNLNIKEMRTKYGKTMFKVTIDNNSSDSFEIIAEKDDISGEMHFYPLSLSNYHNSFYQASVDSSIKGQDEDPTEFFNDAIQSICIKCKGTIAFINSHNQGVIIKDGNRLDASIGLVDKNGNVYSSFGAKKVKANSDTDYEIITPITEWVDNHLDVKQAIAKIPLNEKMNLIGKYLIQAKVKNEIDAEEFIDIFTQAGSFGFTDPQVLNIYKLIV